MNCNCQKMKFHETKMCWWKWKPQSQYWPVQHKRIFSSSDSSLKRTLQGVWDRSWKKKITKVGFILIPILFVLTGIKANVKKVVTKKVTLAVAESRGDPPTSLLLPPPLRCQLRFINYSTIPPYLRIAGPRSPGFWHRESPLPPLTLPLSRLSNAHSLPPTSHLPKTASKMGSR